MAVQAESSLGGLSIPRKHIACLHPAEVPTIDHLARACWDIFYTRPDRDPSALDSEACPEGYCTARDKAAPEQGSIPYAPKQLYFVPASGKQG